MEPLDPKAAQYFDNAATSPLDPRVLEAMLPYLRGDFGNAHSIHHLGTKAMAAVDRAREQVGAALGWDPALVTFTSGATEANNLVLAHFESGVVSPYEHSSVLEPALARDFKVADWPPIDQPNAATCEVQSIMRVNNETGMVLDPMLWIGGDFTHSDVTQALGKIVLTGDEADYVTCSAHKIYGPKGVGAVATGCELDPVLLGGGQEGGRRAGTLNVPGIVGFGVACSLLGESSEGDSASAQDCRSAVLEELRELSDWLVNAGDEHVPHILNVSFAGIEGESLVFEVDRNGFAISAGAACSSGSTEPSHVLVAMGIEEAMIRGAVRISFGRFNDESSARTLGKVLVKGVESLRRLKT